MNKEVVVQVQLITSFKGENGWVPARAVIDCAAQMTIGELVETLNGRNHLDYLEIRIGERKSQKGGTDG